MPVDQIPAMVRSRSELAKNGQNSAGSSQNGWDPATDLAEFGQNGRDPAGSDRIRRSLAILAGSGQTRSPESSNGDRTLPDSGNSCIFTFRNFFVQTKIRKIFLRNYFF